MKSKEKKGISLIVLVITIIVIIILATVIILTLSGSDIRGKTEEAVISNDISTVKEIVSIARSEWEIKYDELKEEYEDFKEYANEKLKKLGVTNMVASNTGAINIIYKDKNEDTAIIPQGFSVSKVASEQTIDNGLVIIDKDGNEFVWVPVDNYARFERTSKYKPTEDITNLSSSYSEPYKKLSVSNDPIEEYAEWTAMRASVKENDGFYIARYEAGKEGANTVVSKKGATAWNWMPWGTSITEINTGGAVHRARQMYKGSKSVVSTLCYGVQWDAALQFIATKDAIYPTNSTEKGNYTGSLLTTGYSDDYAVNNIYDMAGNVKEWTMEARNDDMRVLRGSGFDESSSSYSASLRHSSTVRSI